MAVRPSVVLGSQEPRIYTPPLRELTEETSLGFACIEFASRVCGIELFPWQRWLLIHALELAGDLTLSTLDRRGPLDPIFRFRKIVVLVARQNGKSTLSQVLSLFFMYELGIPMILGTAQDLDTAEEVWDGALDIIEETPYLSARALKPIMVNGKKTIRLRTGERYKVKAANRRAGRGLSGDLILLDELREHQSWDAWAAVTKTTNARPAAMIWAMSNAGDSTSLVLRYLRKRAHADLGDPDGINADETPDELLPSTAETEAALDGLGGAADEDAVDFAELGDGPLDLSEDGTTLGIFEWSAKQGAPVTDIDGILQANPSVGHCINLRTLLSDAREDPEWVFRTECLCQWSDGLLEGPFPPGAWEAGRYDGPDPRGDPGWQIVGPVSACIDVSHDRTMTYIAFAGWRTDGLPQVEIVAQRAGQGWVADWLTDPKRRERISEVTGQTRGAPVSQLMKELQLAGLPVIDWTGDELAGWTGLAYDLIRQGAADEDGRPAGVRHLPWPALDAAAGAAVLKPLGERWVWDRKNSPVDAAPLVAFCGALALLVRKREAPKRSAYESRAQTSPTEATRGSHAAAGRPSVVMSI